MRPIAIALSACLAAAGCGSSDDAGPPPRASLASAALGALTVELLTEDRLETGASPVYVRLRTAAGQPVTDAAVTVLPMMAMTTGASHSAPIVGPTALLPDGDYRCDVVFQMPSGAAGSWTLTVGVARPGAAAEEATFDVTVADSGLARTFVDGGGAKHVMSLGFLRAPRVGLNPVVVTLHRMVDMMTFAPVEGASLALDPQMPSMGHGSPGSVDPVATSPGIYAGQLSFSMAGEWEVTVTATRDGAPLGAPRFAVTF